MPCVRPLEGWLGVGLTDRGRRPVVFGLHSGYSDYPVDVPCGACIGCKQDHARGWSVRAYHESTQHAQSCFATLTYADPAPPKLCRPDLQKFFKRLRKRGVKFRYLAVGEYGGRTKRPHYHVLFFGQDFLGGAVSCGMGPRSQNQYYVNERLTREWGLGHVVLAPAEPGSIFYTCGYALKNVGAGDSFMVSSRVPYIGHGWLSRYVDDVIRLGYVTIGGIRHSIPRSYLLRPEFAIELDALRDRRREFVRCLDPAVRADRRSSLRGLEVNLAATAAAARGAL